MKTKTDSIPYNLSVSALIPLTDTPSSREEGRGGGEHQDTAHVHVHETCRDLFYQTDNLHKIQ